MRHKIKVKLKKEHIKKLKEYTESSFFSESTIHKTVDNNLTRKIIFHSNYVIIDQYSGVTLDSNFLANFNYDIYLNDIFKNWRNPYLFLRKSLGYILVKRWENRKYLNFYCKLWPKGNRYHINSEKIKNTYSFLHYERLLAYNYYNEFIEYLRKEFSLKKTKNINILEIGPGVGNLCMVFQKELNIKKLNYCLIDFSEAIIFSALNLMYHVPNAKFVLPHEVNAKNVIKNESNITFITPEQINKLPKNKYDIGINTNSFHEMSKEIINNYFRMMRKVLKNKNLLFTVNRVEKAMDLITGRSVNTKFASKEIYLKSNKNIIINRFDEYDWMKLDKIVAYHTSEFNKIKTKNNFQLKIVKLKK